MWYFIIFAVTLLIDQISKIIIDANKVNITLIEGVLKIEGAYNYGASFSFLSNKDWAQTFFLILTSIVLIAGIIFVIFSKNDNKWLKVSIALLFSGTIGNFIDRIAFGYVRDFIYVPFFANFNVADSCLVIGSIMLVVYVLFLDKDPVFKIFKADKNGESVKEASLKTDEISVDTNKKDND